MAEDYMVPLPWEKPYIPSGMNPSTSRGYYTGPRRTTFTPINPSTQDGYYTGSRTFAPPTVGGATTPRRYGGAQRADSSSPVLEAMKQDEFQVGADPYGYTIDDVRRMIEEGFGGDSGGGGGGVTRQQIADAIARMVEGARGARREIGTAYDTAAGEMDRLIQQYAAAAAAQREGAGRTLTAFGVAPEQLDVGGMSPQDLLVAQRANLVAQKAAQDAALADRIAAYQTLMGA